MHSSEQLLLTPLVRAAFDKFRGDTSGLHIGLSMETKSKPKEGQQEAYNLHNRNFNYHSNNIHDRFSKQKYHPGYYNQQPGMNFPPILYNHLGGNYLFSDTNLKWQQTCRIM